MSGSVGGDGAKRAVAEMPRHRGYQDHGATKVPLNYLEEKALNIGRHSRRKHAKPMLLSLSSSNEAMQRAVLVSQASPACKNGKFC